MALEEEVPEFTKADDKTIPKYRQIDKRAGPYILEFGEVFDEEYKRQARGKLQSSSMKPKKRPAPSTTPKEEEDAKPIKLAKRVKTESQATVDSAGMTDQDMAVLNDKGTISKVCQAPYNNLS